MNRVLGRIVRLDRSSRARRPTGHGTTGRRLAAAAAAAGSAALAATPAAAFELGVQDDRVLVHDQGMGRARGLELAAQLGATRVRAMVTYGEWRAYGPDPWQQLTAAARARGMRVQLTLTGTPAYQRHLDTSLSWRSASPRRMAAWARQVARQFRGRVDRYSIWNEPNHPLFLVSRREAARTYRALYALGRGAIKGVDPRAAVLVGELAPGGNVVGWLDGMTRGRRLVADGLAMHPYQAAHVPPGHTFPEGRVSFTISNTGYLRSVLGSLRRQRRLTAPGGRRVPVYMSEFGYQTARPQAARYASTAAHDDARGRLLVAAIEHARRAGARQLVLYQLERTPPWSDDEWDTGLVETDGTPTPAYRMVAERQEIFDRRPRRGGCAPPGAARSGRVHPLGRAGSRREQAAKERADGHDGEPRRARPRGDQPRGRRRPAGAHGPRRGAPGG